MYWGEFLFGLRFFANIAWMKDCYQFWGINKKVSNNTLYNKLYNFGLIQSSFFDYGVLVWMLKCIIFVHILICSWSYLQTFRITINKYVSCFAMYKEAKIRKKVSKFIYVKYIFEHCHTKKKHLTNFNYKRLTNFLKVNRSIKKAMQWNWYISMITHPTLFQIGNGS
jgi:hypothetical protein